MSEKHYYNSFGRNHIIATNKHLSWLHFNKSMPCARSLLRKYGPMSVFCSCTDSACLLSGSYRAKILHLATVQINKIVIQTTNLQHIFTV
ncbi:hypothetical protein FKM82_021311 [Ascaphus truei]